MDIHGTSRTQPVTVSALTSRIKATLEGGFPQVWIVGEISNFKRASSGHFYLSLKDEKAQIRCSMWRSYTGNLNFRPADGMKVIAVGSISVYAPRGDYSLMIEYMEEVGTGRLRQEFERLKAKLHQEGLFDPKHKKPLPFFPRKIGIVTSPTGAAIRDMIRVFDNRFPGLHLLIHPARVQGKEAAEEIVEGIEILDAWGECDLIIIGRGGGSEEDLWCFNDELLARTIFEAETPIISAVGHEVDYTIADFVADARAATPSNAAEMAIRSVGEYKQLIALAQKSMERAMAYKLNALRSKIRISENSPIFTRVRSRVNHGQRAVADLEYRLNGLLERKLKNRTLRLARASEGLNINQLKRRVERASNQVERHQLTMEHQIQQKLSGYQQQLGQLISRLDDLSPLKILSRGYATVSNENNELIHSPQDVKEGDLLKIRVAEGEFHAQVIEKEPVQGELF